MAHDCYDDCINYLDEQLDRLLKALAAQGLLAKTDVIITSDHGEAFGDHSMFGHSYTVNLDEIGVPLVILSRRAPAGTHVNSPVSLRDLPATVVDLLGLSAGSPFPGRSLAAYWGLPAYERVPAEITTPAFSEQADPSALETDPPPDPLGRGRFQMSLVAQNHHYIRDGVGAERLFNLNVDPFEMINLVDQSDGEQNVAVFRRMLLEFLTDNPASVEVETAYRKRFRERLEAQVRRPDRTTATVSAE
jgi:arylsulfatase A-like enzyme